MRSLLAPASAMRWPKLAVSSRSRILVAVIAAAAAASTAAADLLDDVVPVWGGMGHVDLNHSEWGRQLLEVDPPCNHKSGIKNITILYSQI